MLQSVSYDLHRDLFPHQMPHHSAVSWQSHWGQIRDRVDEYCGADAFDHVRRRPRGWKYVPANDSSDSEHDSSDQDVSDDGEEDTDSDDDIQNMSGAGGPMTDADKRVMARYVASFTDWDSLTNRDKWGAFEQMVSVVPDSVGHRGEGYF